MSEELLDILAEETLGSLHGLPPGMVTTARLVGGAFSTASQSSSKNESRFQSEIDTSQLEDEEERIATSLMAIVSKTIAKEYGVRYSRTRREQMAQGAVKVIAESPGTISSQDATQTLLSGTHKERIHLIRKLSKAKFENK